VGAEQPHRAEIVKLLVHRRIPGFAFDPDGTTPHDAVVFCEEPGSTAGSTS